MKRIIAAAIALALAGCAARPISQSDADSMAGLTLTEFLNQRFSDAQSTKINDMFIYTARFTGTNNAQLFRPTEEITRLCKAQHGVPTQVSNYTGNPLANLFSNNSFEQAADLASKTRSSAKAKGFSAEAENAAAANAFEDSLNHSAYVNTVFDREGAEKALANTKRLTYGDFECRESKDGEVAKWKVRIVPVGYKPKNPSNQLEPHELRIMIHPAN